ncbi:hypothetical protein [Streptomyces coeruleorubidus]|uniref:hypothetical protein n=1 Tax=Streptomyces coeruleorubidus TaxID=116188 RepID=UPI00340B0291
MAVPQVVTAVRVLEQLGGHGLLFAIEVHDPLQPERRSGRSLAIATMSNRIESFIEWVNAHAHNRGRQAEAIPADPHGRVGTGRFRRTLAWHIARRPGGLVALAVQYGHMRTLISDGYGDPRELHQTGEKSQVASSRRRLRGLRGYYDLAA